MVGGASGWRCERLARLTVSVVGGWWNAVVGVRFAAGGWGLAVGGRRLAVWALRCAVCDWRLVCGWRWRSAVGISVIL